MGLGNFMTSAALRALTSARWKASNRKKHDAILGLAKEGLDTVVVATAAIGPGPTNSLRSKSVLPEGSGPSVLLNQLRPSVTNAPTDISSERVH